MVVQTLCIFFAYAVNFVRCKMHIMSAVNLALGIVTCKVIVKIGQVSLSSVDLTHVVHFENRAGYA